MVEKSTFEATRDALIEFEVESFIAMIDQIKSDGTNWPRNERLEFGHLMEVGLSALINAV